MKVGTTLGTNLTLADETSQSFDFVEPTLNAHHCRLFDCDTTGLRKELCIIELDCTVSVSVNGE